MKKFLFVLSLIISVPVLASCPIDGFTEACSVANIVDFPSTGMDKGRDTNVGTKYESLPKITKPGEQNNPKNYISAPKLNTEQSAKNYTEEDPLRSFRQTSKDFSYNSSCQFGSCNQTGVPQLLQQR